MDMGVAMRNTKGSQRRPPKVAKPYIWPPLDLPSNSNIIFAKAAKDLEAASQRRPNVKTAGGPLATFGHLRGTKDHPDIPTIVVRLRPPPGSPAVPALRWLLKVALRRFGLKCIELREEETDR
jgi:hypothetical protein